jgi:hypothetical protein
MCSKNAELQIPPEDQHATLHAHMLGQDLRFDFSSGEDWHLFQVTARKSSATK